jgi:hypothetical protein
VAGGGAAQRAELCRGGRAGAGGHAGLDAHLVESSKHSALPTYEGYRGYQPLLVAWAEAGLVPADESRDGNLPASGKITDTKWTDPSKPHCDTATHTCTA